MLPGSVINIFSQNFVFFLKNKSTVKKYSKSDFSLTSFGKFLHFHCRVIWKKVEFMCLSDLSNKTVYLYRLLGSARRNKSLELYFGQTWEISLRQFGGADSESPKVTFMAHVSEEIATQHRRENWLRVSFPHSVFSTGWSKFLVSFDFLRFINFIHYYW